MECPHLGPTYISIYIYIYGMNMNEIWVVDYKPGIVSGMHIQVGFPIGVSESGGSAIAGCFISWKTQK